jgi:hypothetical protein
MTSSRKVLVNHALVDVPRRVLGLMGQANA